MRQHTLIVLLLCLATMSLNAQSSLLDRNVSGAFRKHLVKTTQSQSKAPARRAKTTVNPTSVAMTTSRPYINDPFISQQYDKFVQNVGSRVVLKENPDGGLSIVNAQFRLDVPTGASPRHNKHPRRFNPKRDNIANIYIDSKNHISVLNRRNRTCRISDFDFVALNKDVTIGSDHIIKQQGSSVDYAKGLYPLHSSFVVRHRTSGIEQVIPFHIVFPSSFEYSGFNGTFALTTFPDAEVEDLGILFDLQNKTLRIVQLPYTFNIQGTNGRNGMNGINGLNGMAAQKGVDKNGKSWYIPGTCATAGTNGSNGEDGTDGGRLLLCVSPSVVAQYGYPTVHTQGGTGGRGGVGGVGGLHNGGPCGYGMAPSGIRGYNGIDGQNGDCVIITANVDELVERLNLLNIKWNY